MPQTLLFTGCVNRPLSYAKAAKGEGIASFFVHEGTGAATPGPVYTDIVNPTFVALSPDGTRLAAISETEDQDEDMLSLFAVDRTSGALTLLGRQSTGGDVSCHCGFDASGRFVGAANYSAGHPGRGHAISVHDIGESGPGPTLTSIVHTGHGPNPDRQERSHAHCIRWTPDNGHVAVVDLGLDKVLLYRTSDFALVSVADLPPGSGPRHIAFHPNRPIAYVVSEMAPAVTTFGYADGRLEMLAAMPVEPALPGGSGIVIAKAGTHLFVGDRGGKTIARFDIDPQTAIARFVSSVPSGDGPRDLAFSASGQLLAVANVLSNDISLYRHAQDGSLTPLASIPTGTPTGVAFA